MKRTIFSGLAILLLGFLITNNLFCQETGDKQSMKKADIVRLPEPNYKSSTSIEEALSKRRSVRNYSAEHLTVSEVSQILWSVQGITEAVSGRRTAPSAGALYPLEIYMVVSNVSDLKPGIYKYNPQTHSIVMISEGDKRAEISAAALGQESITKSSAMIIISAVYERTSVRYGVRTERYVNMEVGHAGQNIYLQCVSLGIGTVMIGAFNDQSVKKVLELPEEENPLAIYPLGKI